MQSHHFIYLILIFGFFLFCLLAIYTFKRLGKGWSINSLFKEFNRKIWMTAYLGLVFFGLYLLTIGVSIYIVRPLGAEIVFLVHHNPVKFIYFGLWLFAFISLSIYFVRMVIKYFYLTRGKDN